MTLNIETYSEYRYSDIKKEYGSVLSKYGFRELNDTEYACIDINTLEDLMALNEELEKFVDKADKPLPYFGLMIKSYDDGTPYLEIKDNYD